MRKEGHFFLRISLRSKMLTVFLWKRDMVMCLVIGMRTILNMV